MPKASEDRYFGGKKGAAQETYASMVKQYGPKKAEEVYYATLNRNKTRMRRKNGLSDALKK